MLSFSTHLYLLNKKRPNVHVINIHEMKCFLFWFDHTKDLVRYCCCFQIFNFFTLMFFAFFWIMQNGHTHHKKSKKKKQQQPAFQNIFVSNWQQGLKQKL